VAEDTISLGLRETLRFLKTVDDEVAAEVVATVKGLGAEAAALAKSKAAAQGFAAPGKSGRGTGRLIDGIGYSTRGPIAILREKTVGASYTGRDSSRHTYPAGYPYPAIFEFGRKAAWMNRPFLMPAVCELAPEAFRRTEAAVERAIRRLP
jgi:hypothetical protein